jgi:hypothetical protein
LYEITTKNISLLKKYTLSHCRHRISAVVALSRRRAAPSPSPSLALASSSSVIISHSVVIFSQISMQRGSGSRVTRALADGTAGLHKITKSQ